MKKHDGVFIDGAWAQGEGSSFTSINPATAQIVWEGHEAGKQQVDAAVAAARKAFPGWSERSVSERIKFLHAFGEALESTTELLVEAISQETGKPLWESKTELSAMQRKIALSIEAYQERCRERLIPHLQGLSVTRHRAHGVLAVLGPFNLPGHLPNGHITPALLAGNTVVFKPSELTPHVAELMARCWEQAQLPPGVFNLLQGGREVGQALVAQPDLNGLLFTGSWETGRRLAQLFASEPGKIAALEMGGNNPLLIGQLSDAQGAAKIAIESAFLTAGQRCSCARRLIVIQKSSPSAFLDELKQQMQRIAVGAYTQRPEPYMGPLVSAQAAEKVWQRYRALVSKGAVELVPMVKLPAGPAFLAPGLLDVTQVADRPDEEIFGPLLQLIFVDSLEEAIREANRTQYGLTAGLVSDSEQEYRDFYTRIRAGVVNWNMPLTGASSAAPFGGIKHSGNYRPGAWYAADYCSYPVASLEKSPIERIQDEI